MCIWNFIAPLFTTVPESTEILIHWWLPKQNMVYAPDGTLFSHEEGCSTDWCYNTGVLWKHVKCQRADKKVMHSVTAFVGNARVGKAAG
jgi:hypothetical protein